MCPIHETLINPNGVTDSIIEFEPNIFSKSESVSVNCFVYLEILSSLQIGNASPMAPLIVYDLG